MAITADIVQAAWVTGLLALTTTAILLLASPPLSWWIARTHSRWRAPVEALVALPLVLPPTVLGFYLLLAMAPSGPLGVIAEVSFKLTPLPQRQATLLGRFDSAGAALEAGLEWLALASGAVEPRATPGTYWGRRPSQAV